MGLLFGREGVGHAVQIQTVFAQRLAVVGHVDQPRVVVACGGVLVQPAQRLVQKVVGVGDRVVVGVHQFVGGAVRQGVAGAFGHKRFAVGRCALEIRGAVAAHLVQHQHHTACAALRVERGDAFVQPVQHGLVKAFTALAQAGQLQLACDHVGHTRAHAFAARLVVQPQHGQARALQHIKQALVLGGFVAALLARERRKHAGNRYLGVGAARLHLGVIHQVALGLPARQRGRGGPRIAAEPPVLRPRCFAHHHHQQRGPCLLRVGGAQLRVFAHGLQGAHLFGQLVGGQAGGGVHAVERVDHVAQAFVVAHERGHALVGEQRHQHCDQQAQHHRARIAPGLRQPAVRAQGLAPNPPQRHSGHQQHGEQQRGREQVAHFAGIGLHHVGQHGGVDHRAVLPHEVGVERRHQHQQRSRQPVHARPSQQRQQGHGAAEHHQAQPAEQHRLLAGLAAQTQHALPQRHIAHHHQPQRQRPHHPPRRNTRNRPRHRTGAQAPKPNHPRRQEHAIPHRPEQPGGGNV